MGVFKLAAGERVALEITKKYCERLTPREDDSLVDTPLTATCNVFLVVIVVLQVARKIAPFNMAFTGKLPGNF